MLVSILMSASSLAMSRAAGDETDPQAARQGLGEAARVDHAVELIERRQPRRRLDLQVAEDVVLDDREVVPLGGLQDAEGDMRAHVGAGRVLHAPTG